MVTLHSMLQLVKSMGYMEKCLLAQEEGLGIHVVSKATCAQLRKAIGTHMYLEYCNADNTYNVYAMGGVSVTVLQHNNGIVEVSVYLTNSAFAA